MLDLHLEPHLVNNNNNHPKAKIIITIINLVINKIPIMINKTTTINKIEAI